MRVSVTRGGIGLAVLALLLGATGVWASPSDLLAPTNAARNANLVQSLSLNGQLTAAAQARLANMQTYQYFDHVQPDGTSFGEAATAAGYNWRGVAENLACGFNTPQSVINAWMGSTGHRKNLLSSTYREVGFAQGIGYCQGQQLLVSVAIYGTTVSGSTAPLSSPAPAPAPKSTAKKTTPTAPAPTVPAPAPTPTATQPSSASVSTSRVLATIIPAVLPPRVVADLRRTGPFFWSQRLLLGALVLSMLGWLLSVAAKQLR